MRSLALLAMVAFTITCGPSPDAKLPGYTEGTGGSTSAGVGGTTDTGGTSEIGTGGRTGAGGSSAVGTGGKTGSGGRVGTGGSSGSGGRLGADAGRDSAASPDGRAGTDGRLPGTGGALFGTGGAGSGDAAKGTGGGGGAATGGISGTRDAAMPPPDSAGNCLSQLIANGYACGSAPPCSACKDNSTSKAAECQAVLDCIEAGYPCTGNCPTECFNKNGGNGPVQTCVTALQTAACSASGCGVTLPPNGGG